MKNKVLSRGTKYKSRSQGTPTLSQINYEMVVLKENHKKRHNEWESAGKTHIRTRHSKISDTVNYVIIHVITNTWNLGKMSRIKNIATKWQIWKMTRYNF